MGTAMRARIQKAARGFTLIEMLIVVAIVAFLASIAYPAYTSQIAKGKANECRSGLLQSMQQQERYYTQFNKYIAFSAGATNAKTKAFSGETLADSACTIAAAVCSGETEASCIELKAAPTSTYTNAPWNWLTLDTFSVKGCKTGGQEIASTTSDAAKRATYKDKCWP